jgi:hypothetical protein
LHHFFPPGEIRNLSITWQTAGAKKVKMAAQARIIHSNHQLIKLMIALIITAMFAAVGYSIIYLLLGGGLGGAFLIFIIAKMLGK